MQTAEVGVQDGQSLSRHSARRAFEISRAAAEQSDSAAPGGRPHHSQSHMFPER